MQKQIQKQIQKLLKEMYILYTFYTTSNDDDREQWRESNQKVI